MKIDGSVFLITGGSSGMGENMASYFLGLKAIVYICDLKEPKNSNSKIRFIQCDITSEESVKAVIAIIQKEQGRLDVVINSAGILWTELTATDKKTHGKEGFEKTWKVNVFGSFLVAKHAAKLMLETADPKKDCNGNIIFIASVAGYEAQRGQIAYGSSKGGILGMTLPMARDLGRYKIRVNTIAPGIILTPMAEGFKGSKVGDQILAATPLKCYGSPEHISQTAEYIVKCDFVNAAAIRVDGGVRLPHF
jgi:NAD(P)-dependent dehydrogenase (short-subunit alcohol dehydrogenase family)